MELAQKNVADVGIGHLQYQAARPNSLENLQNTRFHKEAF